MKIQITPDHTIVISEGNSKMGKVFSFSVTPVITCAEDVPCKKECYACKLCRIYPSVRRSYADNLNAIHNAPADIVAAAIVDVIKRRGVKLFRFNVSGDFGRDGNFDRAYFAMACRIAAACPDTRFLAFTKVFDAFGMDRPANFNLVASVWNDYAPADIESIPTAHYCDGSRPMPAGAMECDGGCETCGKCFLLKRGEKVFFKKH
jgi:hypothetical protein